MTLSKFPVCIKCDDDNETTINVYDYNIYLDTTMVKFIAKLGGLHITYFSFSRRYHVILLCNCSSHAIQQKFLQFVSVSCFICFIFPAVYFVYIVYVGCSAF